MVTARFRIEKSRPVRALNGSAYCDHMSQFKPVFFILHGALVWNLMFTLTML